mmetsp:Transcript_65926/g.213329  ORF Transcript_65926/g.213329 Transcript_65926/m.213329 type:complete len:559 (-) Transcript_65926:249-1925(-)
MLWMCWIVKSTKDTARACRRFSGRSLDVPRSAMQTWLSCDFFRLGIRRHATGQPAQSSYSVEEKTIAELSADMAASVISSHDLVGIYMQRIAALDRSGPTLRSIIAINPKALADAQALDAERSRGVLRGPLHGIPILVKDNIESADPLPTTAGSLALLDNYTYRDSPAVEKLRAAGAIILGKTNLSEWANFRSSLSTGGWSAVGGLTRNPYALDRSALGSSSGSGAAIAANLAVAALGTETDGSLTLPAAGCGLVGVKPTVGLVSRRHIVPLSHSQDTAGPMSRSVADAACMLTVMAGTDPEDSATWEADSHKTDYLAQLDPNSLRGARVGVARFMSKAWDAPLRGEFEAALEAMRRAGAELVEVEDDPPLESILQLELKVLESEMKAGLRCYLAESSPNVKVRTLSDVIAFNESEAARELLYFGQDRFVSAEAADDLDTASYRQARETSQRLAGPEGIDRLLKLHGLDTLVAPTGNPAFVIDLVNGDHIAGASSTLPAVAGYPHVTVPMGQVFGLPVGLSFVGAAWSEQRLLSLAYSFEQCTRARIRPTFAQSLPAL